MFWLEKKRHTTMQAKTRKQNRLDKTAISTQVLSMLTSITSIKTLLIALSCRHCVGAGESEGSSSQSCGIQTRDYDIPLRIGTLFVVLVTSAIGVFAPMLLVKLPFMSVNSAVMTVIKQFGTGIIISTAFIHVSFDSLLLFAKS